MSEPLEAARRHVQESDEVANGLLNFMGVDPREVRFLRAAMRALIQHVEELEQRVAALASNDRYLKENDNG